MSGFLYNQSSIVIAGLLLVGILLANEAGYRVGRRRVAQTDSGAKTQTNAIQAAMLGLLALLLGFTFTMALQRFDSRSQALLDEANAIGTAHLRTQLLPAPHGERTRALLTRYVELRLRAADVDITHAEARRDLRADTDELHAELWSEALAAAGLDPSPVTSGLFLQALNEMIDAYGSREAALRKHVPESVLMLLFSVFVIAGAVLGYAGGLEGGRPTVATVAMAVLLVLVIFIIIDLDRPRRGVIRVSQESMVELAASLRGASSP